MLTRIVLTAPGEAVEVRCSCTPRAVRIGPGCSAITGTRVGMEWEKGTPTPPPRIFPKLMEGSSGDAVTTMRELLTQTPSLPPRDIEPSGSRFRIDDFVFERIGGEWKFVHAYIDRCADYVDPTEDCI